MSSPTISLKQSGGDSVTKSFTSTGSSSTGSEQQEQHVIPTNQFKRQGRNFHEKFPSVSQLGKMVSTEKDCGERICFLSFKVVENCIIYTKSPVHPFCNVPCDTRDCAVEIVHNVVCPVWFCTQKPTTPMPPTPPPSHSSCETPACIAAASTSGILVLFVLCFLVLFWRKNALTNRLRARLSEYERLEDTGPIFRRRNETSSTEFNRAIWSRANPNVVAFQNIPLNEPGETESSV